MQKNLKPQIAITGPNKSGFTAWLFTALNIRIAGGTPIRVTPETFDGTLNYDGVIIGGGSNVHPDHYIKENSKPVQRSLWIKVKESILYPMELISRLGSSECDKERDDMEIKFIHFALDNNLPLLGICRGHQLLNAELGGTMYESTLPLLQKEARIRSPFPRKTVLYTTNDSLISKIAGDDPLKVNAIHSQAVAKPAETLAVTAKEKAGINQVIEGKNSDKVLGVQWHPEYLIYMQVHRNIFKWLVQEAKK